jgi:hypothetical protein
MKSNIIIRAVCFGLISVLSLWQSAYAEGPGTGGRKIKLDQEPVGPYLVRVVTSPTPPRVENFYLAIRVIDPATQGILTDATVKTWAMLDDVIVEAIATHDIAPIPDEFAAHLPIPYSGVWEISISIDGPLGEGEVSFLERISKPSSIAPILSVGVPIFGMIILGFVFLRLQRMAKEEEASQNKAGHSSRQK